jgi:hypothetical protein
VSDVLNSVTSAAPIDATAQPETAPEFAPVRRRGRPPKNAPGETPAAVEGGAAPAKPRGRPAKKKELTGEQLGTFYKQIAGVHLLAAGMLGIPELQLSEPEAKALGESVMAVCDEYGLSMSGKTGAAVMLLSTAAMIYAPRFFQVRARVMKAQAEHEAANVVADQASVVNV